MSIVNRVYPTVLTPTMSITALTETRSGAQDWTYFNSYTYVLTASITTFTPKPLTSYRIIVETSADGITWTTHGVVQLVSGAATSNISYSLTNPNPSLYIRPAVQLIDAATNILQTFPHTSSIQAPTTIKLAKYRFDSFLSGTTTGSISPSSTSTKGKFHLTSAGGTGSDSGGNGGGGGCTYIVEVDVSESDIFYVDTTPTLDYAFIRKDSAIDTTNEIYGVRGTSGMGAGTGAPNATVSGIFASGNVVLDAAGKDHDDALYGASGAYGTSDELTYLPNPDVDPFIANPGLSWTFAPGDGNIYVVNGSSHGAGNVAATGVVQQIPRGSPGGVEILFYRT